MQSPQSLNFLLIFWLFLARQDRAQVPGPEDIQGRHPSGDGHLAPEDSEEQPAVDKDARPAREPVQIQGLPAPHRHGGLQHLRPLGEEGRAPEPRGLVRDAAQVRPQVHTRLALRDHQSELTSF